MEDTSGSFTFTNFMPSYERVQNAYAKLVIQKVMSATGRQTPLEDNRQKFKHEVYGCYGATQVSATDTQGYCHLLGWQPKNKAIAAHIVPRSLETTCAAEMFGVQDAELSEARNGLTLCKPLENAMDSGWIVFVPCAVNDEGAPTWRCQLVDKTKADREASGTIKLRDVDGMELRFLTSYRPARRYLFFRYLITYLHCKNEGLDISWAEDIEPKKRMWCTPGAYIRDSMLVALAREAQITELPEGFDHETMLPSADLSSEFSGATKREMAWSLRDLIGRYLQRIGQVFGCDCLEASSEDDGSDYSDEE